MPAHGRCHEVCETEDVQAARENRACDSVHDTGDPCYLGFVDAEVRGDRAVPTLVGEELVCFFGGDCRCCGVGTGCCVSVGAVSTVVGFGRARLEVRQVVLD